MQEKLDLKSMSFAQVRALCDSLGFPAFRAGQIFAWCGRGITAFSEMTDLNKADRAALQAKTCLTPCKIAEKFVSTLDGTAKYLIKLQNGYTVEAVVMRYRYGLSACLSTQAGCRMGCAFCASTVNGLGRNLSAGEILDQYLLLSKDQGERIGSVVLMGMGEPLDNYDNVVRFLENIADPMGVGLSHRHITLSTCGLADRIRDLARLRLQITLAVSLHAPNDALRRELLPVARRWDLGELLSACAYYERMTGRRISFEYAMIRGVNDAPAQARELASLLRPLKNCHFNLIAVNSIGDGAFANTGEAGIRAFAAVLQKRGYTVTVRRSVGGDISGSCGQLRLRREEKGE